MYPMTNIYSIQLLKANSFFVDEDTMLRVLENHRVSNNLVEITTLDGTKMIINTNYIVCARKDMYTPK